MNDFMVIKGTIPFVVSAPHAVSQTRDGKEKWAEPATRDIAARLAAETGCWAVIKTRNIGDDANSDAQSGFRDTLVSVAKANNITAGLDLHQMSPNREPDVEIGTGRGNNIRNNSELDKSLQREFENQGLSWIQDVKFAACGSTTVSADVARRACVDYIQLEMNSALLGSTSTTRDTRDAEDDFVSAISRVILEYNSSLPTRKVKHDTQQASSG